MVATVSPSFLRTQSTSLPVTVINLWQLHIASNGTSESLQARSKPKKICMEDEVHCCLQIKEQTPELGKVTQVMKLSLDKAYDYALDPQLAEMRKGVTIRFMPDAQQVKHALEVSFHATDTEIVQLVDVIPLQQFQSSSVFCHAPRFTNTDITPCISEEVKSLALMWRSDCEKKTLITREDLHVGGVRQ